AWSSSRTAQILPLQSLVEPEASDSGWALAAGGADQRATNCGRRFSTNAATPSRPFAEAPARAMFSASAASCSRYGVSSPAANSRFTAPNDEVGPAASCAASSAVRGASASSSTISVTTPSPAAWAADSGRLVSISSLARRWPTSRGSQYDDPPSGENPTPVYAIVKLADRAAIARLAASTRLIPAPAATPCT